jgi:hypothetical protein
MVTSAVSGIDISLLRYVIIVILLAISPSLSALGKERPAAVTHWGFAGGVEHNRFSQETKPAIGLNLSFSPMENRYAVFSLRAIVNYNFSETFGGDFAWRFEFPVLYLSKVQLFIGVEQGVSYININNNGWWTLTINGILSGRVFLGRQFFIEPYGRIGLPVWFAAGILVGMRYDYHEKE